MRPNFALFYFGIIELCALRFREEIQGLWASAEVYVGCDANNLVHSRILLRNWSEMLPNRVLVGEESLRKSLVDHGHRTSVGVVCISDGAPPHDLVPERLKKSRCHAG